MVLAAHSDASFLSKSKSRSRELVGTSSYPRTSQFPVIMAHYPLLSISRVMKHVCASAAEAKTGALFIVAQEMVPLHNILIEMGLPQPRSPLQTNNSTANGYVNNTIVVKRLKAANMRVDWLRCCKAQGQFRIYWDKGSHNMADYHTKHHPPAYHIAHQTTHVG